MNLKNYYKYKCSIVKLYRKNVRFLMRSYLNKKNDNNVI